MPKRKQRENLPKPRQARDGRDLHASPQLPTWAQDYARSMYRGSMRWSNPKAVSGLDAAAARLLVYGGSGENSLKMRYDDFIEQHRGQPDFHEASVAVCFRLTYGDAAHFEDKGWPRRTSEDAGELVLTGAIVNHRTASGDTCGGYVGFAHPINPSKFEAEAPLWEVKQIEPLTISPSVECHCKKLHGLIENGRWRDV